MPPFAAFCLGVCTGVVGFWVVSVTLVLFAWWITSLEGGT